MPPSRRGVREKESKFSEGVSFVVLFEQKTGRTDLRGISFWYLPVRTDFCTGGHVQYTFYTGLRPPSKRPENGRAARARFPRPKMD
jgi:hypothetical protein